MPIRTEIAYAIIAVVIVALLVGLRIFLRQRDKDRRMRSGRPHRRRRRKSS